MENKLSMQLENIATQFDKIIVVQENQVLVMLQKALDDELVAAYQYWAASHQTRGNGKIDVDPQFTIHAHEEFEHANMLIERIKQLGGYPKATLSEVVANVDSNASIGAISHDPCELLAVIITAEQDAIALYKEIIDATKNTDPTTHKLAKQILEDEQQHKYDLQILLEDICC